MKLRVHLYPNFFYWYAKVESYKIANMTDNEGDKPSVNVEKTVDTGIGEITTVSNPKGETVNYIIEQNTPEETTLFPVLEIPNDFSPLEISLKRDQQQSNILTRDEVNSIINVGTDEPIEISPFGIYNNTEAKALFDSYSKIGLPSVDPQKVKDTTYYRIEDIPVVRNAEEAQEMVEKLLSNKQYTSLTQGTELNWIYITNSQEMAIAHADPKTPWIALLEIDGEELVNTGTPIFNDPESLDVENGEFEFNVNFVLRKGMPTRVINKVTILRVESSV